MAKNRTPLLSGIAAAAVASGVAAQKGPPPVDLSGQEVRSLADPQESAPASRPSSQPRDWFRKVDLWGYVSVAYLQTQSGGARPGGSLAVDQASLFLKAEVADDLSAFFEIQTDRFQTNPTYDIQIGEAYARIDRVAHLREDEYLGLKIGRFDIPFGESYLRDDAPDNPLIGSSVSHTYDVDEGILAFGKWHDVNFVAAFTDGSSDRQSSDGLTKAFTAKVYGNVARDLYLSGSVLASGETASSAIYLSGVWLNPVGAYAASTAGTSPSTGVAVTLAEVDLKATSAGLGTLWVSAGYGRLDDEEDSFDRSLYWFSVEPTFTLCPKLDSTLRYSEIGTYSKSEGYLFDGRPFANAWETHGYDTSRLTQLELGLAWRPQPNMIVKGEVGYDSVHAISQSPFGDDTRGFVAMQFVLRF